MHVPRGDIHGLKPSSSWGSDMCMVDEGQHCSSRSPSTILTGTRRYLGKSVRGEWKQGDFNTTFSLTRCLNIQQSTSLLDCG